MAPGTTKRQVIIMSESYWKKMLDFFGFAADEEMTEGEQADNPTTGTKKKKSGKKNKVIKLSRTKDVKLVVHSPASFDGVREIVDDLKESKAVILNLENREKKLARRFIDFLSGSVYALNGSTQKLGTGVFIFTPEGMDVDARAIENAIKNEFISAE